MTTQKFQQSCSHASPVRAVSHGTLANEPFETEARRVERKKCVGGGKEGRKGSAVWCNSCRQLARYGCEARVQCPVWRALLEPSFSFQLHKRNHALPDEGSVARHSLPSCQSRTSRAVYSRVDCCSSSFGGGGRRVLSPSSFHSHTLATGSLIL